MLAASEIAESLPSVGPSGEIQGFGPRVKLSFAASPLIARSSMGKEMCGLNG